MDGCVGMNLDDDFPIRQALPIGARFCSLAHLGRLLMVKTGMSRYNVLVYAINSQVKFFSIIPR